MENLLISIVGIFWGNHGVGATTVLGQPQGIAATGFVCSLTLNS